MVFRSLKRRERARERERERGAKFKIRPGVTRATERTTEQAIKEGKSEGHRFLVRNKGSRETAKGGEQRLGEEM